MNNLKGWDEGIMGLCVGSKANLVIPPDFGYGDDGVDANVPGGATLHFDIEVVSINESPPMDVETDNVFAVIDEDVNGSLTQSEVEAYFENIGQAMPDGLWSMQDKNGDGVISWEEFSGPKGSRSPMGDEL
jgi:FK506-binding protein 14